MLAFVIQYAGGYYSSEEGRVRSLTNAQLFGLKEMAEETANEYICQPFQNGCSILPVEVNLLSTPESAPPSDQS